MTTKYKGGDEVKRGFYVSAKRWTIEMVKEHGDVLPGEESEKYFRLPTIVMLVAAPLAGAAFVMFLPLIGFLMLGAFAWRKVTGTPPEKAAERPAEGGRKVA